MSVARELSDLVSTSPSTDSNFDNGTLVVDVSENRVGIGTPTPAVALHSVGELNVGINGTGHDVIFYGATTDAYMKWDEDVDDLILTGVARVVVPEGQLVLGSTAVGATAAELNLLDGVEAPHVIDEALL